jgi:hypothetical protein
LESTFLEQWGQRRDTGSADLFACRRQFASG